MQPLCTIRTSPSLSSIADTGLPFVSVLTYPPDFFTAARRNIPWSKSSVFLWVPLGNQFRLYRGQAVFRRNPPPGAIGAALTALTPFHHLCLPFMLFLAHPPNCFCTVCSHVLWRQITIFDGMPFLGQQRKHSGQTIVSTDLQVDTVRTAGVINVPAVHTGAKCVTLSAKPPNTSG